MFTIPKLRCERLNLRAFCRDDWPNFLAMMQSSRAKFMGGPLDLYGAWGMFCHETALWRLMGHGGLAIELSDTGNVAGMVDINAGPLFPEPELGWFLYDYAEGNGYASEAAALLKDWARKSIRLPSLVSYIDEENRASIQVARRLDGRLDPHAEREDPTDLVYRYW
ncbi:GNAT family N-acetyltransferase [Polycladidibacter hongkongensis]|uniref:GNAT family N-acetyltransferase n=1 Tax=Polycladidibacter hongkongensis TaxID=1647556 RepID=UPI00082C1726|nr:GNAT family N-acetyltransferase [Pseudovibrio hongkongensis]